MPAYIPENLRYVNPDFMVSPNLCLQLEAQAHDIGRI